MNVCAVCKRNPGEIEDNTKKGVSYCLDCFGSLDPTAEEPKNTTKVEETKQSDNQTTCALCHHKLDDEGSVTISGNRKICLECAMHSPEDGTEDQNSNPLTDSKFVNYLIFSLVQDEEGQEDEPQFYSAGYLHIEKKNPANTTASYMSSACTVLPVTVPDAFSSVTSLSAYQYLITGGCITHGTDGAVPSSIFLAVVLQKSGQYFNFAQLQGLNLARFAHASVVLNNSLYVIGGLHRNAKDSTHSWLSSCERTSLEGMKEGLDTLVSEGRIPDKLKKDWETVAKLNHARANFNVFAYGENIYAFGGFSGPKTLEKTIEKYHPGQNKWEDIDLQANLQKINYNFLGASLLLRADDQIYIIGGSDGQKASNQVVKLDAKNLELETLKPLNRARAQASGFVAEKVLYVFGGENTPYTVETLSLQDASKGFQSFGPVEGIDKESGLLVRGFIGNYGFYIQ